MNSVLGPEFFAVGLKLPRKAKIIANIRFFYLQISEIDLSSQNLGYELQVLYLSIQVVVLVPFQAKNITLSGFICDVSAVFSVLCRIFVYSNGMDIVGIQGFSF